MLVKIIDEGLYTTVTHPDVNGNVYFNPTPYGEGFWYITSEDVNNCTFTFFDFLKNHDNIEII